MLSQRQIEILLELCQTPDRYLTASYFAAKLGVSIRTIQNDIKLIKDETEKIDCIRLKTEIPKGSRIIVQDEDAFTSFKDTLYKQYANVSMSYQTGRVNQILSLLLSHHRAVSLKNIEDKIYVSHSTLLNDLKKTTEVLQKYSLDLLKSANKVMIDGTEINKRLLLADLPSSNDFFDEEKISHIKNILLETLMSFHYYISDTEIKNAIIVLDVAVKRIQKGFYINPEELHITDSLEKEKEIAVELFKRLERRFLIKAKEEEINYFALYLKGQENMQNPHLISTEIDEFITAALLKIKDVFGIDFTDDINLRISLALHCTPLLIRIKYDMQVKNNLLEYIKKTFPQGYDLGVYFSFLMRQKYNEKISEDETAFIAIYFYSSLMEMNSQKGTKRVAVITSQKRSQSLLLRQTLLTWFIKDISILDFVSPAEVSENILEDYDVLLTTEKGEFFDKGVAMYINPFPNNQDYQNIKLAMDGFRDLDDFLNIFHEELFYSEKKQNKDSVLEKLCRISMDKYGIESLYEEVLKREELGSTFFSKSIAVPHPMHAVSSDTFVAVGIFPQAIEWDEEKNPVNLVLLVCIGKNNPQAFQLWNYLSKMYTDSEFVKKIIENPSYSHFVETVKNSFNAWIKENDTM